MIISKEKHSLSYLPYPLTILSKKHKEVREEVNLRRSPCQGQGGPKGCPFWPGSSWAHWELIPQGREWGRLTWTRIPASERWDRAHSLRWQWDKDTPVDVACAFAGLPDPSLCLCSAHRNRVGLTASGIHFCALPVLKVLAWWVLVAPDWEEGHLLKGSAWNVLRESAQGDEDSLQVSFCSSILLSLLCTFLS